MATTYSEITVNDPDVETVDDYIWRELENWLFDPPQWWPTYAGARSLYRHGMFGRVLNAVERMQLETVETALNGDCYLCDEPEVGAPSPELQGHYDAADGGEFWITTRTPFCDSCAEKFINDVTAYGTVQPTLEGFA